MSAVVCQGTDDRLNPHFSENMAEVGVLPGLVFLEAGGTLEPGVARFLKTSNPRRANCQNACTHYLISYYGEKCPRFRVEVMPLRQSKTTKCSETKNKGAPRQTRCKMP